jgi:hypothetical protein
MNGSSGSRHQPFALFFVLIVLITLSVTESVKNLKIVSPLKALTIWDPEAKEVQSTPRSRFLPQFKARLNAEAEARKALKDKRDQELQSSAVSGDDWAAKAAAADRSRRRAEERFIERASDKAAAAAVVSSPSAMKKNANKYQFVGVVDPKASGKPIKWYARKKPASAKWSVRLVHVDQAAILTDLFRRGEVDIFAKYKNTGKVDEETNVPVIESEYTVRERSFL